MEGNQRELLDDMELESSSIVANCRMNREREISGTNSYAADLRLDVLQFLSDRLENQPSVAWLDLCCGSGRALIQTATHFAASNMSKRVRIDGVDLVSMFASVPATAINLNLHATSINDWTAGTSYDLITCVHGLHYVGDKLGIISRAASWLTEDGLFIAHLDLANLKQKNGKRWSSQLMTELRHAGFEYARRPHLISCIGRRSVHLPYIYQGADDNAGPNFSGQPAVNSFYAST